MTRAAAGGSEGGDKSAKSVRTTIQPLLIERMEVRGGTLIQPISTSGKTLHWFCRTQHADKLFSCRPLGHESLLKANQSSGRILVCMQLWIYRFFFLVPSINKQRTSIDYISLDGRRSISKSGKGSWKHEGKRCMSHAVYFAETESKCRFAECFWSLELDAKASTGWNPGLWIQSETDAVHAFGTVAGWDGVGGQFEFQI